MDLEAEPQTPVFDLSLDTRTEGDITTLSVTPVGLQERSVGGWKCVERCSRGNVCVCMRSCLFLVCGLLCFCVCVCTITAQRSSCMCLYVCSSCMCRCRPVCVGACVSMCVCVCWGRRSWSVPFSLCCCWAGEAPNPTGLLMLPWLNTSTCISTQRITNVIDFQRELT